MKLSPLLVLFFLSWNIAAYSQKIVRSSLNSFGNSTQNNKIILSQTVGQASNTILFISNEDEKGLYQGFQQPLQPRLVKRKDDKLEFQVYPNPNRGDFSVTFKNRTTGELNCRVVDGLGRIYKESTIKANPDLLFRYNLPAGVYFLQIKTTDKKSGTSKIIILP